MKSTFFAITVLTISCAHLALSATWRGMANDENHPGKCLIDKTVLVDYGQEYHPKDRCEKISCLNGGEIVGYSCGIKIIDGCTDAGYVDVSLNYPDCCLKKFICIENGVEKIVEM